MKQPQDDIACKKLWHHVLMVAVRDLYIHPSKDVYFYRRRAHSFIMSDSGMMPQICEWLELDVGHIRKVCDEIYHDPNPKKPNVTEFLEGLK